MRVVLPKSLLGAPALLRILVLGFLSIEAGFAESFFGEHARGWHWYEVLPEPDKEDKTISDEQPLKGSSRPQTPTELIKAYREALESRLHAALLNPTPQNIKLYQEMQKDLMNRSQLFATVWMQNVFQTPELDHTLVSPVNQQGRHLQIDLEKDRTARTIQNLSQEYGLFFFFSSDCPYCHQFAPIVKRFAETYGWEVIAISVDEDASRTDTPGMDTSDSGLLVEFPNAQRDNGLFKAWDVKVLPALFAVNPRTEQAIPIAYGLTSLDEMENRIMTLMGDKP